MYSSFDAVGIAIAAAVAPGGAVHADRARFAPYLEEGERFVHAKRLVVGGETATKLLLGEPLGYKSQVYDVYSESARRDAWGLADALHARGAKAGDARARYTKVATLAADREFVVSVDERDLFRVHALAVHRGARVSDLIVAAERPAFFARTEGGKPLALRCMGPEIQLLSTYAALTDPAQAGAWPALVEAEVRLRALFGKEIRRKFKSVLKVGGGAPPSTQTLIRALVKDYVPRVGHVVVGSHAARALGGKGAGGGGARRLQVVAAGSLRDEEVAVGRVAARLGFSVQSTTNDVKTPTDPRMRRLTMYLVRAGERRVPFLDVYNSGSYELVPFVRAGDSGAAVGTPYVVLRFLLVDMWTILLLNRMSRISAAYAGSVLESMLGDLDRVAGALVRAKKDGRFEEIFPTRDESYTGRHVDSLVAARRERKKERRRARDQGRRTFFPPYYPGKAAAAKGGDAEGGDAEEGDDAPWEDAP